MNHRTGYRAATLAVLLVAMTGCGSSRNPGNPSDTVAPTVSSTSPADGATETSVITASFSEAMNASTITTNTFAVRGPGETLIAGTVIYSASSEAARFTPARTLATGTIFTATITTGVTDAAGNELAIDHVWTFTTSGRRPVVLRPLPVKLDLSGF